MAFHSLFTYSSRALSVNKLLKCYSTYMSFKFTMGLHIGTEYVSRCGNSLKLKIHLDYDDKSSRQFTSPEFTVHGSVIFQFLIMEHDPRELYFVKFVKKMEDDDLSYTVLYTHWKQIYGTQVNKKCFSTDVETWHLCDTDVGSGTVNVTIEVNMVTPMSPCANLHEDTELTDFVLRGEDGSVILHKAVAAAHSPVFKTMFAGEWRETAEGATDVPGTSKETLQHLKDYMYLGTLPKVDGLKQLLLLSSYYMIKDLEQRCIKQLQYELAPDNAVGLMQFALQNNIRELLFYILDNVQSGDLSVEMMRKHESLL